MEQGRLVSSNSLLDSHTDALRSVVEVPVLELRGAVRLGRDIADILPEAEAEVEAEARHVVLGR